MLSHHLVTLYRSLSRHRLYTTLNVLGLAVGIAVFLVLALLVRFEVGFDRWWQGADHVYRLNATYSFPGQEPKPIGMTSGRMMPDLLADYPQIQAGVRITNLTEPVANGAVIYDEAVSYVDPSFFAVLKLPLVEGDARTALASPSDAVVTEIVARRYFGRSDVIGRSLTISQEGQARAYRISAVMRDLPDNTHLALRILAPLTPAMQQDRRLGFQSWGAPSTWTYLRFLGADQAKTVADDLGHFVDRRVFSVADDQILGPRPGQVLRLSLVSVPSLHFADARLRFVARPGVDHRLIISLGGVGFLTLLIAVLNYVNLATGRAALRAREIALRKVMGATRRSLISQLLMEALALTFAAGLIGLALAELALPMVNALGGTSLRLSYWGSWGVVPWLVLVACVVGLGAGLYPAFVLSSFEPAAVLASVRTPGGGRWQTRVRGLLIGIQFVVAIAFTIVGLVIGAQANLLRNADRGFDRQGLVFVDEFSADSAQFQLVQRRQTEIIGAFRRLPDVLSVTSVSREPGLPNESFVSVRPLGRAGAPITIDADHIGPDYLKTIGARLVAGRPFDVFHGLDDTAGLSDADKVGRGLNVMLNMHAVRSFGMTAPARAIGSRLLIGGAEATVIGVVGDIQFGSPQTPMEAVVYEYDSRSLDNESVAIRFAGRDAAHMVDELKAAWSGIIPQVPFAAHIAEAALSDYYVPEQQRGRLFSLSAALAVMLSGIGLYGLAAFNTKEPSENS